MRKSTHIGDDKTPPKVADTLVDSGLYLAMITPGAHSHFAYGGIASWDEEERKSAESLVAVVNASDYFAQRYK